MSVGKEVPGTELRPLIYNYFKINKIKGNYFILNTIDKKWGTAYLNRSFFEILSNGSIIGFDFIGLKRPL